MKLQLRINLNKVITIGKKRSISTFLDLKFDKSTFSCGNNSVLIGLSHVLHNLELINHFFY